MLFAKVSKTKLAPQEKAEIDVTEMAQPFDADSARDQYSYVSPPFIFLLRRRYMPHSIYQRKTPGKGLVSTTFGFQKTGSDVYSGFWKKVANFSENSTLTAEDGLDRVTQAKRRQARERVRPGQHNFFTGSYPCAPIPAFTGRPVHGTLSGQQCQGVCAASSPLHRV